MRPTGQILPLRYTSAHSDKKPAFSASARPILEKMISVSRDYLGDGLTSSPGTVQSLWLVELHLTAIIQYAWSSQSLLPNRGSLLPNQCTWTQTAKQMGAKCWKRTWSTNKLLISPATNGLGNSIWNNSGSRMLNSKVVAFGLAGIVVFFLHLSHPVCCGLCRKSKLCFNTILIVYCSHKLGKF